MYGRNGAGKIEEEEGKKTETAFSPQRRACNFLGADLSLARRATAPKHGAGMRGWGSSGSTFLNFSPSEGCVYSAIVYCPARR